MELTIRPVEEQDIPILEQLVPRARTAHRDRYLGQLAGDRLFLVACDAERLIGTLVIRWAGQQREPMRSQLKDCPNISNVWVDPVYRRQGIATALLDHAEDAIKAKGYAQVGLGVAVDNAPALQLYHRHHYAEAGLDSYLMEWETRDEQGQPLIIRERCVYLVKNLNAAANL